MAYQDYAVIVLRDRNNKETGRTQIDLGDIDKVINTKWYLTPSGYVIGGKPGVRLHRYLVNAPPNMDVDHKDQNKLNNKKDNLRLCLNEQNARNSPFSPRNTSGIKGVYWDKRRGKWAACICVNTKNIWLGYYEDIEKADKARLEAEIKYFGEFAPTVRYRKQALADLEGDCR